MKMKKSEFWLLYLQSSPPYFLHIWRNSDDISFFIQKLDKIGKYPPLFFLMQCLTNKYQIFL